MIHIAISIQLNYDIDAPGSDFIFNIHAAMTPQQTLISEQLHVSQSVDIAMHADQLNHNRVMRFSANAGALQVNYQAVVVLQHVTADAEQVQETPVAQLPWHVLPYLYPSRYCQSDQLHDIANQAFGCINHGYLRVQAIRDWVLSRVTFHSNTSNEHTTALDTVRSGVGVCRDFSHLMIALCRALNIPARFVTGIDYGSDPALGPTDFHAYVEAYLDGRWYIFDASGVAVPMGLPYRRKSACNLNLKLFNVWAMPRNLNAFRHRSRFTFPHATGRHTRMRYHTTQVTLHGAWTGPCSLELHPHALAPVSELPVLEVVSCLHFVADLTLGLGEVVHDYLT